VFQDPKKIATNHLFKMYIQIKKAELVPDQFGQHIRIKMIGLYDDEGKWIKWIKLTPEIVEGLLSKRFTVSGDKLDRMMQ